MVFVWIADIELDLKLAWAHRCESGITAGLALAMLLVLSAIVAAGMVGSDGWVEPKALT